MHISEAKAWQWRTRPHQIEGVQFLFVLFFIGLDFGDIGLDCGDVNALELLERSEALLYKGHRFSNGADRFYTLLSRFPWLVDS